MFGGFAQINIMRQRINLVPKQALASKIKSIIPFLIGALIVLSCLGVFLQGRQVGKENITLQNKIENLNARKRVLQDQQAQVAQLSSNIKNLEDEEKQLRKVVSHLSNIPKKKQIFSELLFGLSEIMPSTIRCERIDLSERGGEIEGKATEYNDLPKFVNQINSLPRFSSASLNVLNQSDRKDMELLAFTIVFQLKRQP